MKRNSSDMFTLKRLKDSLFMAFWLSVITFPIMVIKINTVDDVIIWRWWNLAIIAAIGFFGSYIWNYSLERVKLRKGKKNTLSLRFVNWSKEKLSNSKIKNTSIIILSAVVLIFPLVVPMYNTSIMTTALIYVVLGLGLNIIIGLGGMLHLGYAAFFSVGAYTYALLYQYLQINFWIALPLGGVTAFLFGLLVGIPVLRLGTLLLLHSLSQRSCV